MKKTSLIFLIVVSSLSCFAQDKFEPHILILSPKNIAYDPSLQHEIDTNSVNLKKMVAGTTAALAAEQGKNSDQPENIKLMQQNSIDFLQHITVFNQILLYMQQYLTYRFYEKFPNCLVLIKNEKSKINNAELQAVADSGKTPYILNFPSISFYKQNGQTYCKLALQLYDRASNSLLIDKEYSGYWNNPGFEFSCQAGTMGCTINNAMAAAMPDVIEKIASNNPTLIREKQLAMERAAYISSSIYPQTFDASLVKKVIPASDQNIQLANIYQCFYNGDKTKFAAFFLKTVNKDAKALLRDNSDKNVKVLTKKDIKDTGYFDQKLQTYAYIVKGLFYNQKWYYEKTEVTYFDADNETNGKIEYLNNLQGWDFFEENTAKPDDGFWEGKLFEKITDKRKDPNWEKYKDMWESEERENRDYIGLYEMVADQLKKENAEIDSIFNSKIFNTVLLPFYNKKVKTKQYHFNHLTNTNGYYCLIYPKDRSIIINPVEITDEHGINSVRYFVLLTKTKEIYEWKLIKPNILKKGEYSDEFINNTIGGLTTWNLSYKTLDDTTFWNEKVLAKDGDNFKYLEKLP